jgi:hypothetical protein
VTPTNGRVEDFAAAWASDTVVQAKSAFNGISFTPSCDAHWLVHFANRADYRDKETKLKEEQLAKAGAHLAELLNAIWQ